MVLALLAVVALGLFTEPLLSLLSTVTAPVVVPFGPIRRVPDDASPSVPSAAAGTQHADAAVAQRMQQPVHELIPAKLRNDGALGQRCRALSDGETGRHWAFDDDRTGDGEEFAAGRGQVGYSSGWLETWADEP